MSPNPKKPIFVLVPGALQNPSHYAHLHHLLQSAGHGTFTGLLPSIGATDPITAADDAHYIRHRLLLPLLDVAQQDVILISHSYSGMPADRAAEGKSTAVLGQIFIASILPRGGDGSSVIDGFGRQLPPHIQFDQEESLLKCADPDPDPVPPLFYDVEPVFAAAAARSALSHGYTSFASPCPEASWPTEAFRGRVAYVHTLRDCAVPYEAQRVMVEATGVKWVTRELDTGHSP